METKILVLLPNNVEEIEFITPVDLWRRAGYTIITASITNELITTGQQGIKIVADIRLSEINCSDFDCLFLPGGSGHQLLEKSPLVTKTIQYFVDCQKTIIAICAASTILIPWLHKKKATCYPSLSKKIPYFVDQDVVVDMPFITGKGAGTAAALAFCVISLISGADKAKELQHTTLFL